MRKPNLIIAGCQKCGTTWLHRALSLSPDVFGSEVKELNYFSQENRQDLEAAYMANFPVKDGVRYYMESTPHYFRGKSFAFDIAKAIKTELGQVKILVVFRDPVERYESAYIHHMMQGRLPYAASIDKIIPDHSMLSLGRYAGILSHWRGIFEDDLKELFYDDLKADPLAFVGDAMDHLQLSNPLTRAQLDFRTNDKKNKALKLPNNWKTMPRLSDRVRAKLYEKYSASIESLEDMTGRDLSHWRHETRVHA